MKKTNHRVLNWVCVFVVVLASVFLFVNCSKTYEDSALTNPIQQDAEFTVVRYLFYKSNTSETGKVEIVITPAVGKELAMLFEDSQQDPHSMKWQSEGLFELVDDDGDVISIDLFSTGRSGPDAYRIGEIYYRKAGLISALELWVAEHQELQSPESDIQNLDEEPDRD